MAGLVFAAIAPHGSLAIPEACASEEVGLATATQQSMSELGRRFDAAEPDATIVLTPHNIHLDGAFAVILGGAVAGTLPEAAEPVALTCPVDIELAAACLTALEAAGVPALGVSFGANDVFSATMPLDWGALIPLWYMGGRRRRPLPVVLISPSRSLIGAEHVRAGAVIARTADASGKRIALVASADHGHAHDQSGPYGYDPAARTYDELVTGLVRSNRLAELLDTDQELIEAAKVDSWWQMLMLHGAIGDGWRAELLSYEAPTYFGMLCAAFSPPPGHGSG